MSADDAASSGNASCSTDGSIGGKRGKGPGVSMATLFANAEEQEQFRLRLMALCGKPCFQVEGQDHWAEGFGSGYASGSEDGYAKGYASGYDKGCKAGFIKGYVQLAVEQSLGKGMAPDGKGKGPGEGKNKGKGPVE